MRRSAYTLFNPRTLPWAIGLQGFTFAFAFPLRAGDLWFRFALVTFSSVLYVSIYAFNSKFNEASNNYAERCKEFDDNWYNERQEKRKVQGFETHEQIAEWAPEFPENIRVWMRYIGKRVIRDSAEPEFAKTQLRCIGNLFMAANGLANPTFKQYINYKWQEFKAKTDKWGWFKWYIVFIGIIAIMLMLEEYQSRVMKLEQVNHIFYEQVMSDPAKAKEYHDIDSLVNAQPILKKHWKME